MRESTRAEVETAISLGLRLLFVRSKPILDKKSSASAAATIHLRQNK